MTSRKPRKEDSPKKKSNPRAIHRASFQYVDEAYGPRPSDDPVLAQGPLTELNREAVYSGGIVVKPILPLFSPQPLGTFLRELDKPVEPKHPSNITSTNFMGLTDYKTCSSASKEQQRLATFLQTSRACLRPYLRALEAKDINKKAFQPFPGCVPNGTIDCSHTFHWFHLQSQQIFDVHFIPLSYYIDKEGCLHDSNHGWVVWDDLPMDLQRKFTDVSERTAKSLLAEHKDKMTPPQQEPVFRYGWDYYVDSNGNSTSFRVVQPTGEVMVDSSPQRFTMQTFEESKNRCQKNSVNIAFSSPQKEPPFAAPFANRHFLRPYMRPLRHDDVNKRVFRLYPSDTCNGEPDHSYTKHWFHVRGQEQEYPVGQYVTLSLYTDPKSGLYSSNDGWIVENDLPQEILAQIEREQIVLPFGTI